MRPPSPRECGGLVVPLLFFAVVGIWGFVKWSKEAQL